MRRVERMPGRPILRLWMFFTSILGTVVMWSNVVRDGFGETVLIQKNVTYNTDLQQCQIERGGEQSKTGRVLETGDSRGDRAEQEITIFSGAWFRLGSGPTSIMKSLSCALVKERKES